MSPVWLIPIPPRNMVNPIGGRGGVLETAPNPCWVSKLITVAIKNQMLDFDI
jgi:hypothetical protein